MNRRWLILCGAAAVVLAALVAWLVWRPRAQPPPRARPYLEYTACLLTDGRGPVSASVWSGMQDASLATRAKVQYLQVAGESTAANAMPYLASLVQRRCAVVFAVGTAQVAAVAADAPKFPGVRFVAVGGSLAGANVTNIDASDLAQVRGRVDTFLRTAVRSSTP